MVAIEYAKTRIKPVRVDPNGLSGVAVVGSDQSSSLITNKYGTPTYRRTSDVPGMSRMACLAPRSVGSIRAASFLARLTTDRWVAIRGQLNVDRVATSCWVGSWQLRSGSGQMTMEWVMGCEDIGSFSVVGGSGLGVVSGKPDGIRWRVSPDWRMLYIRR